jgi:hypothetical protein
MRIFISYAVEHRSLAEHLAAVLKPLGHKVFLDRHQLLPGETYTDQIRKSIERSELFVFLISPEAVTPGRYTMTELQVMQEIAPSAGRRVLPVMASPTPMTAVPDYLRNVTILLPSGDVITDTLNAIAGLEARAKRRRLLKTAGYTAAVSAVTGLGAFAIFRPPAQAPPQAGLLRDPFSVYGSNFVSQGETAVVNLTNRHPDLIREFTCRVDVSEMKQNIETLDHDDRCEAIRITTKAQTFVDPRGKRLQPGDYDRTPMDIEVLAKHGEVIWRGRWEIGFKN